MGGNRTLNRQPGRQKSLNSKNDYANVISQRIEDRTDLKLITLTQDQEERKDLKFVNKLPKTKKSVSKTLKGLSEEEKLVVIQRIRDYHNPMVSTVKEPKFKQFVAVLLQHYLSKEVESEAVLKHVQELGSKYGELYSALLKNKLSKIISVLESLKN